MLRGNKNPKLGLFVQYYSIGGNQPLPFVIILNLYLNIYVYIMRSNKKSLNRKVKIKLCGNSVWTGVKITLQIAGEQLSS